MTRTFLLAASFAALTASLANAAEISVKNAFARATPPGAQVGGVFMMLTNSGASTVLIDGETDLARDVQIHSHTIDDADIMRMRQLPAGLALPEGETATLAPGGYHIMLLGLTKRLVEGETLDLTLKFGNGTTLPITVPIKSIAAKMESKGMDHSDGHATTHGHSH